MTMTHEQLMTLGKVLSVLGAVTIFAPWLEIHYYDHYGAIYESYNGLTLFNSGYYFGLAMFVPIVIMVLFIVSFMRYKTYNNTRNGNVLLGMFLAMFFLSWYYNIASSGVNDNYPYFTESYYTGIGETAALTIGFINMIVAYVADKRLPDGRSPSPWAVQNTTAPASSDEASFCPFCGNKLTTESGKSMSYCPYCGRYIGPKTH